MESDAKNLIGTTIGGCVLKSVLGQGNMGSVFVALHSSGGREVAVKILKNTLAETQEQVKRFIVEASIAMGLDHPNIVKVEEFGIDGDYYFLRMELVKGESLASLLRHGPLPVITSLRYITQVLNGLSALHQKNIVHRDIKPSNILITPDEVLKIVDLGLVKVHLRNQKQLTRKGSHHLGTLSYMPPEQSKGEKIDIRGDIYSLGATLYHMVTGIPPYDGKNSMQILLALSEGRPPLLPTAVNGHLPPGVEALILKMMAFLPQHRYADTQQVIEAIEIITR